MQKNDATIFLIFTRSTCIQNFKFIHYMTWALDQKQFNNDYIVKKKTKKIKRAIIHAKMKNLTKSLSYIH